MQKNQEHTLQGVSTEIVDTAQKLYALIIRFELIASGIQFFDVDGKLTQVYWYDSNSIMAEKRLLDAIAKFQETFERPENNN